MTSTIAAKVIEGLHSQGWQTIGRGGTWAGAMRPLEQYIQRKVERAVKAERKACAKLCEDYDDDRGTGETWGPRFAAIIRARKNT